MYREDAYDGLGFFRLQNFFAMLVVFFVGLVFKKSLKMVEYNYQSIFKHLIPISGAPPVVSTLGVPIVPLISPLP